MEASAAKSFPQQVPLTDADIARAASEFLATSTERRKRSRSSTAAEPPRKKSLTQNIDTEAARKSALDLMAESPSFKRLVHLEEQLDLAIMRKQHAIKETLDAEPQSESRIFRLYIFNTYRSQPGAEGVTSDDVPSWSLRLQGKLLPRGEGGANESAPPTVPGSGASAPSSASTPGVNPPSGATSAAFASGAGAAAAFAAGTPQSAGRPGFVGVSGGSVGGAPLSGGPHAQGATPGSIANAASAGGASYAQSSAGGAVAAPDQSTGASAGAAPRCSDIFSRIVVELDKQVHGSNNVIEWKRKELEPAADGFEISRSGSSEFMARIFLYIDHKPTRFKLSAQLARLIGVRTETRSGVFASMWQYVKKNRLQCVDDRSCVRLDDGLKSLLGPTNARLEVMKLHQLFALVKNHMGALDPLKIEYDVKLSGDVVDNQDCYDVHVNVMDTSMRESARRAGVFGTSLPHSPDYDALQERHLMALEKIAVHKKRRDFFERFCANPVQFINHLILSQTRDLKVLGGGTGRSPEEERRGSFYQQQWVHEAVPRYLLRKAIADTAEDTVESALKGQ